MIELYDYQDDDLLNIARSFAAGTWRHLHQLATGGGKTVEFSAITGRWVKKQNTSVLICVHRVELLNQTRKTLFDLYGITAFEVVAGVKYIPQSDVYIGMVESVMRRIAKLKDKNIRLLIIDECHIASFNKLQAHFPLPCRILGVTATPKSSVKKFPVKMFYDTISTSVPIKELIKRGKLAQNITWSPKEIVDRKELAMKGDDFDDQIMAQAFKKPKYIKNTVDAYEKWGKDTKTMIYNVNVAHSKEVTQAFVDRGYNCRHVDGEMSPSERKEIFKWFVENEDAILCNVGIATVGYDEPTILTIIVNKATQSMPLWLQMCGRGGRIIDEPFIKKKQALYPYQLEIKNTFVIIDMGGNGVAHGDWSQDRDWKEIFNNPPKPGSSDGVAPVKSCVRCEALIPANTKICPHCGYQYANKDIPPEVALSEFVIITKAINIEDIMREHANKKEYYPFFAIGKRLAKEALKSTTTMSEEYANFILQTYFDLGKKWIDKRNELRNERRPFNKWHKAKAEQVLFTELEKNYPEWQRPVSSVFMIESTT